MSNIDAFLNAYATTPDAFNVSYLKEATRQKLHIASVVGRATLRAVSGFSFRKGLRGSGVAEKSAMTTINGLHYFTDETVGLALLPSIKASLSTRMPEALAGPVAVAGETTALVGIMAGLGLANLAAKRRNSVAEDTDTADVSLAKKSAAVVTMGVPFAVQAGFLKSKTEIVKQSVFNFGGSYALFAGGLVGGAEILDNDNIFYGAAAYLIGSMATHNIYDREVDRVMQQPDIDLISASYQPKHRQG